MFPSCQLKPTLSSGFNLVQGLSALSKKTKRCIYTQIHVLQTNTTYMQRHYSLHTLVVGGGK